MTKKSAENKAASNGSPLDATSKLEVIKDLIFGENMAAYNAEFEQLKEEILAKKKELESLLDSVREELTQNIDNLSTDLNIRITELEDSLNQKIENTENASVNRDELSSLLIKLGESIRQK